MAESPAKAGKKQGGSGRFRKGQSGNPAGKKPGTRNKATVAVQTLLHGESDALTRKCVEMALEGDTVAMRLCLERIIPPCKDSPLEIKLPPVTSAAKLSKATAKVVREVAAGNLTPSQGEAMTRLLSHHQKALELSDLDERIKALEDAINEGR